MIRDNKLMKLKEYLERNRISPIEFAQSIDMAFSLFTDNMKGIFAIEAQRFASNRTKGLVKR